MYCIKIKMRDENLPLHWWVIINWIRPLPCHKLPLFVQTIIRAKPNKTSNVAQLYHCEGSHVRCITVTYLYLCDLSISSLILNWWHCHIDWSIDTLNCSVHVTFIMVTLHYFRYQERCAKEPSLDFTIECMRSNQCIKRCTDESTRWRHYFNI